MKKIKKPWGEEIIIENNKFYSLKKLTMNSNSRCSLQYHKKKIETIFVLEGVLNIEINKKNISLMPGESVTIKAGEIHRMSASDTDALYLESSTPDLEDVIRIEDDFGRNQPILETMNILPVTP